MKICLASHCDINAAYVDTEVPSELHRASVDQLNMGQDGSMEMPLKSLAKSTNKPCCHFDSRSHREGHRNNDQFTIHRPTFRWLDNGSNLTAISLHTIFVRAVTGLLRVVAIKASLIKCKDYMLIPFSKRIKRPTHLYRTKK